MSSLYQQLYNPLLAQLENAQSFPIIDEIEDYITKVNHYTNQEIVVLEKKLAFSKTNQGANFVLQYGLFDPSETATKVVDRIKSNLNSNQRIILNPLKERLQVNNDEAQLNIILCNIIDNAIKATPEGTITLSIQYHINNTSNMTVVTFTIEDNGCGMTEEELQQAKIGFIKSIDDFFPAMFDRNGVGLATCYNLISRMGGTMAINSEKGVGTTVVFRINSSNEVPQHLISTMSLPRSEGFEDVVVKRFDSRSDILLSCGSSGVLVTKVDWKNSSLGSIEQWPQSLFSAVVVGLKSLLPTCIFWGPESILFYNDSYIPMIDNNHPALGLKASIIQSDIGPILIQANRLVISGEMSTLIEDRALSCCRSGVIEECYVTISSSAIIDEKNNIGGVIHTVIDTTKKIVDTRRINLLSDLSRATELTTKDEAIKLAIEVISKNSADVTFAVLYNHVEDASLLSLETYTTGIDLTNYSSRCYKYPKE